MAFADLDALGTSAQVTKPIAVPILPEPFAGRGRELARRCRCDGHLAGAFDLGLRPLRIGLCLIAQRAQGDDTLLHAGSFRSFATELLDTIEDGFKNPEHRQQRRNTLTTYTKPMSDMPIADLAEQK